MYFIKRARRFLAHLDGPILASNIAGNRAIYASLQQCAITVNTALVNVYVYLASHGYVEAIRKCVGCIIEVVSITRTVNPDELNYMNPFALVGTPQERYIMAFHLFSSDVLVNCIASLGSGTRGSRTLGRSGCTKS